MNSPPPKGQSAVFAPGFGQRVLLTVDTEEEFDWTAPFTRDRHGLTHVPQIARFQAFCETIGARPVYLVDWPIIQNAEAVDIISDAVARGKAEVGAQLHPWVTPPFDETVCARNSYAGNLPPALEEAKLMRLRDGIEQAFGIAPLSYRAGRYGLGASSAQILKRAGIAVDTSVRTLFDYSPGTGPDYSNHPLMPYWVDRARDLLELPVSSVYRGALRGVGPRLHKMQRHVPALFSGFARLGLLERVALTPEGVTIGEALRGIDRALELGLPVLVLSFHSPSLAPGHTPYVKDAADVDRLYEWFAAVYAEFAAREIASTSISEIIAATRYTQAR